MKEGKKPENHGGKVVAKFEILLPIEGALRTLTFEINIGPKETDKVVILASYPGFFITYIVSTLNKVPVFGRWYARKLKSDPDTLPLEYPRF